MILKTIHHGSIFTGRNTSIGNIPKKAYDLHGLSFDGIHRMRLYNKGISIKFINPKTGAELTFSGNEIVDYDTWKAIDGGPVKLVVGYSGNEYKFGNRKNADFFRKLFQYDDTHKNDVIIEITSNI